MTVAMHARHLMERMTGIDAPMVFDGLINGNWIEAHAVLGVVPDLHPGYLVIMSTISSHDWAAVGDKIEVADPTLRFIKPCKLDQRPFKALFQNNDYAPQDRQSGRPQPVGSIGKLVDVSRPIARAKYFKSRSHEPE